MHPVRKAALLAATLLAPACAPDARPADAELYLMALERVSRELRLEPPVPIHPLPAMLSPGEAPGEVRVLNFNEFDTTLVASIVARDGARYRRCETAASGSCAVPNGGVSLVLSELRESEEAGASLIVIATDRRAGTDALRYYRVRLNGGLFGWGVVELRRLD